MDSGPCFESHHYTFFLQMKDLLLFMLILLLTMMGYGVAIQALQYPNSPISVNLLKDIFYMPYWQIYGELFLDDIKGKN